MTDHPDNLESQQVVPLALAGRRLDQIAAELFQDYSRSRIQQWIKEGNLQVDGVAAKAKQKLFGGEQLALVARLQTHEDWQAQPLALDIIYTDEHLIVLNKPAGLVVHPGAGAPSGTLLNGLLHQFPELSVLPRAGIVHRLDKDTTGLMVVARTLQAQTRLAAQLADRSMTREYWALCCGLMTGGGRIEKPIERHPQQRTKMAIAAEGRGKPAITHYRIEQRYRSHTLIRCKLETGRTHQIRVHLSALGYPLVGDPLYLRRARLPRSASPTTATMLHNFRRQALHAGYLELRHPEHLQPVCWQCGLPADMAQLLAVLAADSDHEQRSR